MLKPQGQERGVGKKGRSTFDRNADFFPETFSVECNSILEKFLASKRERNTQILDKFLQEIFGPFQLNAPSIFAFWKFTENFENFGKFPRFLPSFGKFQNFGRMKGKTVPIPQLFAFEGVSRTIRFLMDYLYLG